MTNTPPRFDLAYAADACAAALERDANLALARINECPRRGKCSSCEKDWLVIDAWDRFDDAYNAGILPPALRPSNPCAGRS